MEVGSIRAGVSWKVSLDFWTSACFITSNIARFQLFSQQIQKPELVFVRYLGHLHINMGINALEVSREI